MEVKTQASTAVFNSAQNVSVDVDVKQNWWGRRAAASRSWEVAVTTAVATSNSKATSETNTSSIYVVKMGAKSRTPVGLTMMLDFITNNAADGSAKMEVSEDGFSTGVSPASDLLKQIGLAKNTLSQQNQ